MRDGKIWGTGGITIVIPPSGEQGKRLLDVAREWTSIGLLRPSIWLSDMDSADAKLSPPKIFATVIGSSKAGEVQEVQEELFSLLAQYEVRKVRLVVVRQSAASLAFDQIQDQYAEHVSGYLEASTPPRATSERSTNEDFGLVKLNLMTSPTEHEDPDSSKILDPFFNAHFVASSEDKAGVMTADAFIRDEVETPSFAGFAMLHLASVGALWTGIPVGTFEIASGQITHQGEAFVSRVFVSAILTDGLVLRACARVLDTAADPKLGMAALGLGLTTQGTYPIPEGQSSEWVRFMVDLTFSFENGFLSYKPSNQEADPEKQRFGFKRQLIDFFKFSWDRLKALPRHIFIWFRRKLTEIFNNLFQGGGSGSAIVGTDHKNLDPRDRILMEKYQEVFIKKEEAERALVSPVSGVSVKSTPDLWEQIRKLVFSMLDGSNQHLFGIEKSENGNPVFYDLTQVFADPSEELKFPVGDSGQITSLGWGSYREWQQLRLEAETRVEQKTGQLNELLDQIIQQEKSNEEAELRKTELEYELSIRESS